MKVLPLNQPATDFYERELRGRLECGGAFDMTVRGKSLVEVVEQIVAISNVALLPRENQLSVELAYWELDEDCSLFEVTISVGDWLAEDCSPTLVCREIVRRAQAKFLTVMSRQGITLFGERGSLQNWEAA